MAAVHPFRLCATGSTCLLSLLVLSGCGGGAAGGPADGAPRRLPLVSIEAATRTTMTRALDLTAEVVPVNAVRISCMVEGPIGFCPWREGDRVEAGQKLVEIDREMYRAEVKAAQAALAVAEAKLADLRAGTRPEEIEKARQSVREAEQSAEFEKDDFERIAQLVGKGSLAGEELEKARVKRTGAEAKLSAARQQLEMLESGSTRTAIAVQEATVKEAEAKLELAEARHGECLIAAPFAGTITAVLVRKGDMAAMRAPLLEMADLDSLVIRAAVPEAQAAQVRPGLGAEVQLDALPGRSLPAEVARVYPELDARMRTRTIELTLQEEVELVPGMFGRVRLILESVADAVAVPVQAVVVTPAGTEVVFIAAEGKAVQRKVETGIEEGGRIQILSGIEPGEHVITAGQERLRDGVEVRLPDPPKGEKLGGAMASKNGGQKENGPVQ